MKIIMLDISSKKYLKSLQTASIINAIDIISWSFI